MFVIPVAALPYTTVCLSSKTRVCPLGDGPSFFACRRFQVTGNITQLEILASFCFFCDIKAAVCFHFWVARWGAGRRFRPSYRGKPVGLAQPGGGWACASSLMLVGWKREFYMLGRTSLNLPWEALSRAERGSGSGPVWTRLRLVQNSLFPTTNTILTHAGK